MTRDQFGKLVVPSDWSIRVLKFGEWLSGMACIVSFVMGSSYYTIGFGLISLILRHEARMGKIEQEIARMQ